VIAPHYLRAPSTGVSRAPGDLALAEEGNQEVGTEASTRPGRKGVGNPLDLLHTHFGRASLVSAILLIPCFWQTRLEAGDLESHVYNVWLVQLIKQGRAPGLWIARQWNNVLLDVFLFRLGSIFGLQSAQRISAALMVLVFFWGVFLFISVLNKRPAWFLTPILGMIAYGWTFQEGLCNYYFSIGLAFWGLAAFCTSSGRVWLAIMVVLVPLIYLAHPLGVIWMLGAALCIGIGERIGPRSRILSLVVVVGVLVLLRVYLLHHFESMAPPHPRLFYNGLDQFLFSYRYAIPVAMLCILMAAVLIEGVRRQDYQELLGKCAIPLGLYLTIEAAVQLLPDVLYLPQYAAPLSRLTDRLTLISMVLLCCWLGAIPPRRWHLFAFGAVATIFFTFLYQDNAALKQMQEQAERLVKTVPPGSRIMATIVAPHKYRFNAGHILEAACVGRCFSYGNYEPASGQFRVRALPGNAFVASKIHDIYLMEQGMYVVQGRDLPAYQLYQCGSLWTDLCLRPLQAGETNDRLGVHPK
jgi:hypothetical protein